jgi:uncharacterized protein (DUF2235 family)
MHYPVLAINTRPPPDCSQGFWPHCYIGKSGREDPMTDAETASSGARKLAVFLDGTWDQAIGNTNVWRLKSLCAPGADQLIFYSAGVGTSFGERLRGAVFGYGIDDQLTLT